MFEKAFWDYLLTNRFEFWSNFFSNFLADLIIGIILGIVGGYLINKSINSEESKKGKLEKAIQEEDRIIDQLEFINEEVKIIFNDINENMNDISKGKIINFKYLYMDCWEILKAGGEISKTVDLSLVSYLAGFYARVRMINKLTDSAITSNIIKDVERYHYLQKTIFEAILTKNEKNNLLGFILSETNLAKRRLALFSEKLKRNDYSEVHL